MPNKLDYVRDELLPKHALRVPEDARPTFTTVATSMLSTAAAQVQELRKKEKTGLYKGDARAYLVAQLRDETRQMFDVIEMGALTGVRDQLTVLHKTRQAVPRGNPDVARELRETLRTLPKDDRENAIRQSLDPDIADAVLNAPGGGIGLGISDNGKQMLLRNYNETHRPGLLQQISDAEALIGAVDEFRRTVSVELMNELA